MGSPRRELQQLRCALVALAVGIASALGLRSLGAETVVPLLNRGRLDAGRLGHYDPAEQFELSGVARVSYQSAAARALDRRGFAARAQLDGLVTPASPIRFFAIPTLLLHARRLPRNDRATRAKRGGKIPRRGVADRAPDHGTRYRAVGRKVHAGGGARAARFVTPTRYLDSPRGVSENAEPLASLGVSAYDLEHEVSGQRSEVYIVNLLCVCPSNPFRGACGAAVGTTEPVLPWQVEPANYWERV